MRLPLAACAHVASSPTFEGHATGWRCGAIRSSLEPLDLKPLDQSETPLIDALEAAADAVRAPFFFPGHKMGAGAPRRLRRLLRGGGLRYDLPELPELDNLFAAEGPIARAQQLAAAAFGAGRTWFLVNGSTAGVIAAVLACCQLKAQRQPGRRPVVVLPRNVHKSAIHALVSSRANPNPDPNPHPHPDPHPDPHPHPALDPDPNPDPGPNPDPDPDPDPDPNQVSSGAEPLWLAPEYDAQSGLCLGLRARAVERALHAGGARVAAVLVVSD